MLLAPGKFYSLMAFYSVPLLRFSFFWELLLYIWQISSPVFYKHHPLKFLSAPSPPTFEFKKLLVAFSCSFVTLLKFKINITYYINFKCTTVIWQVIDDSILLFLLIYSLFLKSVLLLLILSSVLSYLFKKLSFPN